MELLRPFEYARLHGLTPKLVSARVADGRLQSVRLPPSQRSADGRDRGVRIPANARLRYTGPTVAASHRHGGIVAFCGGPGKIRRYTLRERAEHARKLGASCGCELCAATAQAERQARERKVFAALLEDQRVDEDARLDTDEEMPRSRFGAL